MKRLILLAIVALVAAMGFAQTTGLESVESNSSFGIFGNELDAALTVQEAGNRPVFSDLTNRMFFGGISNLNFDALGGVEADALFTATAGNPLWVGYFSPGERPFSLFLGMFYAGGTGNLADMTDRTSTTKAGIVSGTTTTDYEWISQSITWDYTGNRMFDRFQKQAQVIMPLGGMNIGLGADVVLVDNSPQANNYVYSENNYYDTAIGTEAPATALDYTYSATRTDLDKTSTFGFSVPIFMRTGELGHTIVAGADMTMYDDSYSYSNSYTDPADGALAATVTEANDGTVKASDIGVNAGYQVVMPALFGDNEANEFTFGAGASTAFRSAEASSVTTTQAYTWAGTGAAAVAGTRNDDSDTAQISGQMDFGGNVMASHSFNYTFGENVRFGLVPQVWTAVDMDNEDWLVTSDVAIDRTDGDADGAFTTAADTIDTITTTFVNTSYDPVTMTTGDVTNRLVVTTEFGVAGALEFTPANWPFSIVLGSRPRIVMTNTKTTTLTSDSSTSTASVDGTGVDLGTTVTQAPATDETTVWNHAFTVDAEHRIGLNMLLGNMVRLDVALNLSSGVNILDFKDMVIQGIVKLP